MDQKEIDTYKTIQKPITEVLLKEKKSKFLGFAYPITQESEIKPIIESLKQKYNTANHVCYAWQLGTESLIYKANDDGEPSNSAGMPIYGQIKSFKITNTLVAVVRIFGGTKLGVGGLISAYKNTAELTLKEAVIIEKILTDTFEVSFSYKNMNKIMRLIKQYQLQINSQKMELNCVINFSVRKKMSLQIENLIRENHEMALKKITN